MSKFLFSLVLFVSVAASANQKSLNTEVTCVVPSPDGSEELLIGITSQYDMGRYALVVRHVIATGLMTLEIDRKVNIAVKNEVTVFEDALKSFSLLVRTAADGSRVGNLALLTDTGALSAQNITCSSIADKISFELTF